MDTSPGATTIELVNLAVATLALLVSGGGIALALRTLDRGNHNSSAALVYSMQLGFIGAWESYLSETDADKAALKMSHILGLIETSAAIYCDTAMTGSSGELMEEYLRDILSHIAGRPELVEEVRTQRHTPTTFVFLDRFIDAMEARGYAGAFMRLRRERTPRSARFVYERRGGHLQSAWHNFRKPDFPGVLWLAAHHAGRRFGWQGGARRRETTSDNGTTS